MLSCRPYGANRPIWRLPELLKAHKGQASWRQIVVTDPDWELEYIQMAPGDSKPAE